MEENIKIGLYQRLRNVFGSDFRKVKPKDHKRYGIGGTVPCDWGVDEMCLNDGLVYISGNSYCAEHAVELVQRYENDTADRLSNLRSALLAIGLNNIDPKPGGNCAGILSNNCCCKAVAKAGGIDYCLPHAEFVLQRHQNSIQSLTK